ncbi:hypothetical protein M5K25_002718 [Dendrobium thyrsiflorum]|uniref:Uncharacterized protein n=1 Tax=Dendrobium thyrsiflorum TaxID=117978 RepID=A0ABD0VP93_DENTH
MLSSIILSQPWYSLQNMKLRSIYDLWKLLLANPGSEMVKLDNSKVLDILVIALESLKKSINNISLDWDENTWLPHEY